MGTLFGILIVMAVIGLAYFVIRNRRKPEVRPAKPGAPEVDNPTNPKPQDPVITDDEGDEYTEDDLNDITKPLPKDKP